MKKLYVIRHAKSSWKDFSLDDFDRPLNKRGKLNAPFMGALLKKKKVKPDLILSSPALRAKTTAEVIAKELECVKKIVYDEEIYEASAETLHKILIKIDDKHGIVFLFGHNPGLNDLAWKYVAFDKNIPTCGVVEVAFDTQKWSDIDSSNTELMAFEYPKKYKNL